MSRERDRSLTAAPSEIERDITEQIEEHASRAMSRLLRRVLVAVGWSGAGLLGGAGSMFAMQDDDAPIASTSPDSGPAPAAKSITDTIPPSLLVPPADERMLEACEQAGADARRAIRDARLCVDAFAMAVDSCDPAAMLSRHRRPATIEDP